MANNQLYTTAAVYLNDNLLSEAMSVSIKINGNHQIAKSLAKGFSGVSKGAVMTEISVSNNIPQDGFEADVVPHINNVEEVQLTIFLASSTLTVKGFILSTDVDKGVDSEAKQGFTFQGGESSFD
jgi:hypothetical protein